MYLHCVALLLLFVSCGRPSSLVFEEPGILKENAFQSLKANFFEAKCVGCHKNFKIEENLLPYINGNDPEMSQLFEVVQNGSMPKNSSPLSTRELEMIRNYIKEVEVIRAVSFAELKESVLNNRCISCHKKASDESYVIDKWVNKKSLFESKLYTSTLSGSMPKNDTPLSKAEIKIIKGFLKAR